MKISRTSSIITLILTLVANMIVFAENSEPEPPGNVAAIAEPINELSADLYQRLAGDSVNANKNLFYSPLSISACLSMARLGADGDTAGEMQKALKLSSQPPELQEDWQGTLEYLNKRVSGKEKLNIANALCLVKLDAHAAYKQLLEKFFDAEIFKGDVDAVNNWVDDKTEGMIKKLVDQLPDNTGMVLLNAIYFKGAWEKPFDEKMTREDTFNISKEQQVTVDMMMQKERFRYAEKDDVQVLSLPYQEASLSMILVLPKETDGLAAIEKSMNASVLNGWIEDMDKTYRKDVCVFLPKFKFNTTYPLNGALKAMGIHKAFDPASADFSIMGGVKGDLYIQSVLHKAVVDVNEEGTEAAATTGIIMGVKSINPTPPPVFRADHPFLFLIRDNATNSILFMGRVMNPAQ